VLQTRNEAALAQRRPAQYGREVVRRILVRFFFAVVVLGGLPAFLLFVVGAPGYVVAPLALAAIATMLWADPRVERALTWRVQGAVGEERVGAILEDLRAEGWCAVHDVATGRGNVDHIVVGPGGLFTVETKSRRGRVDVGRIDERWLKQAYAQRKHLERATGRHAECLLVFSNAYLSVPISRERGVVVLPARLLASYLKRQRPVYTPAEIASVSEDLDVALAGR
jgi:Nuclease-related domain